MDNPKKPSPASLVNHPLGGLPPEVWEKILLDHVEDPESLLNCYHTCVTFKKILTPEKARFLFPLVAPILNKLGYLPTTSLVNYRLICKIFRFSLDLHHFSKNPPHLHRDTSIHSGIPPYIWYNDTTGIAFNTSTDLRTFTTDFPPSSPSFVNPFFHKTVKCISRYRNNEPESNRLFEDFTSLISEHGPSIQRCVYIAYGGRPESERQMENIFIHLPNLTSVAILKHGYPNPDDDTGMDWITRRKDLLLPSLPHLTSINIFMDDAPQIADILLLSYGRQIESFHCDFRVISTCPYLQGPVVHQGFKDLKELDILDAFGSSTFLERLLLFEMPRFERLSLEYVEIGPRRQALLSILKVIDKHSESLKEIRLPQKVLNWNGEEGGDNKEVKAGFRKSAGIELMRVECLGIGSEILGYAGGREWFFKKFPNLDTLQVTNYGVGYREEKGLLKELRGKTTSFWKWIPSLRRISVERAYLGKIHLYREQSS